MTIVPYVCAEFHDRTGAVLYSVKSRQLGTMIFDAPDSIRQDPLFGMLVADGSFRIPQDEKEKKLLENEPYQKAPGKVEEERSSPAPAEGKPSGRKTAEKKA